MPTARSSYRASEKPPDCLNVIWVVEVKIVDTVLLKTTGGAHLRPSHRRRLFLRITAMTSNTVGEHKSDHGTIYVSRYNTFCGAFFLNYAAGQRRRHGRPAPVPLRPLGC